MEALACARQRSDGPGLLRLGTHLGALAVTGASVVLAWGTYWALPAVAAHGVVMTFLFAPLHECVHRTAFAGRRLNDAVATGAGFLLLLPPRYFRAFHFAHHRWTRDADRDPELSAGPVDTRARYLWRMSGIPFWIDRLLTLARHAAGRVREPYIGRDERPAIVREARRLLTAWAGVAALAISGGAGQWLLALWALPALAGQPWLRLYLLAEHAGCPWVPDMLRNTRTTLTLAPLRWLTWNMPFHAEHHAWPAVPFHQLPRLHAALSADIEVLSPGYLDFHRRFAAHLEPGAAGERAA